MVLKHRAAAAVPNRPAGSPLTASWNPVAVTFGRGTAQRLESSPPRSVIAIVGEHCQPAAAAVLGSALACAPVIVTAASWDAMRHAASAIAVSGAQRVIGWGGGSVMDVAKVAATLPPCDPRTRDNRSLNDVLSGAVPLERRIGLTQVPTTAGTGSEVTPWATVWTPTGQKVSIQHHSCYADTAIIDPALTTTMSPRLTAATGLDALGHAAESIWSIRHRDEADTHAVAALHLIGAHLTDAVTAPTNATRDAMSLAALHAGLALSWSRSAAAHALSYPLTGLFGLEHGLAVGLTLLAVLGPTHRVAPHRVDLVARSLGCPGTAGIEDFIRRIFRDAGLPPRLGSFGIDQPAILEIIQAAHGNTRMANHPAGITNGELSESFTRLL